MPSLGVADSKAAIDSGTITGATINNCVIGGTTAVAGTFTDLTSTGNTALGNAVTDTIGLYGVTPVAQPSGGGQAAVTDASGGTAAATNGILTLTGTYNSTILANAIATLAAQGNALRSALVSIGAIKGSA